MPHIYAGRHRPPNCELIYVARLDIKSFYDNVPRHAVARVLHEALPPDETLKTLDIVGKLGGPGDFAAAYVIGHEVGHHVQTLLGTSDKVHAAQQRGGETAGNRLQVAMELQADCFAGVWAYHANQQNNVLEPGDVDEGLAAAEAIGDDRLQRNAGRRVTPDSFTHGSSAQRQQWLKTGLTSGDPAACDTFR